MMTSSLSFPTSLAPVYPVSLQQQTDPDSTLNMTAATHINLCHSPVQIRLVRGERTRWTARTTTLWARESKWRKTFRIINSLRLASSTRTSTGRASCLSELWLRGQAPRLVFLCGVGLTDEVWWQATSKNYQFAVVIFAALQEPQSILHEYVAYLCDKNLKVHSIFNKTYLYLPTGKTLHSGCVWECHKTTAASTTLSDCHLY